MFNLPHYSLLRSALVQVGARLPVGLRQTSMLDQTLTESERKWLSRAKEAAF